MIRRVLMVLGLLVGTLTAVITIGLLTRESWQEEWTPEESRIELKAARPVVLEKDLPPDSAFSLLVAAAEEEAKLARPVEIQNELSRLNLEPWSDAAFPVLSKLVADGGRALDLARSAAAAPNPQMPTRTTLSHRVDYLQSLLRLNDVFRVSAARSASQGNVQLAFEDLATSMAVAQILTRGGVLFDLLVDFSSESRACRALRLTTLQQTVPTEVSRRMIERLQKELLNREPLAETFRQEYRTVPIIIQMLYGTPSHQLSERTAESSSRRRQRELIRSFGRLIGSGPEQITADMERAYKDMIGTASAPYDPGKIQQVDQRLKRKLKPYQWLFVKDPVGYLLARTSVPSLTRLITSYHRQTTDINATMAVLALRQFQQQEQRTPTSLDQLVPKYLAAVPNDPFDGKPLRFRIGADGKWIVYSVGPNQMDEGGIRPKSEPRDYDDPGDFIFSESDVEWERHRLKARNKGL